MKRNIRAALILPVVAAALLLAEGPTPDAPVSGLAPVATDSIAGRITYSGPQPVLKTYSLNSEPDCEKKHPNGVQSQEVVLNPNHTLRNVLVYVITDYLWSLQPKKDA